MTNKEAESNKEMSCPVCDSQCVYEVANETYHCKVCSLVWSWWGCAEKEEINDGK